jgi:O-antigen ligase
MRDRIARGVEAIGLALFAYLLWRVFFGVSDSFDQITLAVGAVGVAAAVLGRRSLRTFLDVPIAVYIALVVVSMLVNRGRFPILGNLTRWQPLTQLLILILFFYGSVSLLRTRARLGLLVVVCTAAISLIGTQSLYDYLRLSVAWRRIAYYPSVGQWSGYPQLGMLFVLALAFPLSSIVWTSRRSVIAASVFIALVLLAALVAVNSRITLVAAIALVLTLGALELVKFKRFRLLGALVALFVCVTAYVQFGSNGTFAYWWKTRLYLQYIPAEGPDPGLGTGFGRFPVWRHVAGVIRDNPWIGVGPPNYLEAVKATFPDSWHDDDIHAHNTFLHVAAETGIPAALVLLGVWGLLFLNLASAIRATPAGVLAISVGGALLAFFVCSMTDHFTAYGLAPRERIGLLIWTLIAAAVVIVRLSKAERMPQHAEARV